MSVGRVVAAVSFLLLLASEAQANSVRVSGRFGLGHVCLAEDLILTAAHLVDPVPFEQVPVFPVRWQKGILVYEHLFIDADLALLKEADGQSLGESSEIDSDLQVGDEVWWYTPLWEKRGKIGEYKKQTGKVTRFWGGDFFVDKETAGGSSGGCVFRGNKVVGIVAFGKFTKDSKESIGAVSIFGEWATRIRKALKKSEEPVTQDSFGRRY